MTSKRLVITLDPGTYSWVIRTAEKDRCFPDSFVEELVKRARQQDEPGGGQADHQDRDLPNPELRDTPRGEQ